MRIGSFVTVVLLTGALASSAGPAAGGDVRTQTTLGGFSMRIESAPLRVMLDDPSVSIPRPPGSAIVEADPSYTLATLDSGPTSRAVASSLWPGNLFGDGWSQIVGQIPIPGMPATYPFKADARYPDNPHEATAGDNGALMRASAEGLDVLASARANPTEPPGALSVGSASSTAAATVKDGVAIGTAISHVSDVSFMGGLVTVGSVSTTLTTTSDGKKPSSKGSTVVSGLTVGGVGYVVDERGARPVGVPGGQGTGPLPANAFDPAKMLGITISAVGQAHSQDATSSTRTAAGLQIVVDTKILRAALSPVTGPLQGPLGTLISHLPKELQGYAYMAEQTTPKVTLVLGSGNGSTAATLPLIFSFPPLTFPTTGGAPAPGPATVSAPSVGVSGPTSVGPTGPGPSVAGPAVRPLAATRPGNGFGGIPAGWLLLAAAVAASGGYGLLKVRDAALATEPDANLPDLRGE